MYDAIEKVETSLSRFIFIVLNPLFHAPCFDLSVRCSLIKDYDDPRFHYSDETEVPLKYSSRKCHLLSMSYNTSQDGSRP